MNLAEITEGSPWLGRMGLAAFLFFLVKGLLWLAAPFLFLLLT